VTETTTLAAVVHGESGSGKSYFGGTTPAPRLILECEGGSRFIRANRRKRFWDPLTEPVPEWDDDWDACFVRASDWATVYAAYEVLATGNHPFRSLVVDSLTEAQKRLIDDVAGIDQPTLQEWGTVGRNLEDFVRKLRDLTFIPSKPLEAVVLLCLSHQRDGELRPFLKGQIELNLPAFVDVVGYLYTDSATGVITHNMLIAPARNIIAKDRTAFLTDKYGMVVQDANFTEWLSIIDKELNQ
jgi:hypothetical protein